MSVVFWGFWIQQELCLNIKVVKRDYNIQICKPKPLWKLKFTIHASVMHSLTVMTVLPTLWGLNTSLVYKLLSSMSAIIVDKAEHDTHHVLNTTTTTTTSNLNLHTTTILNQITTATTDDTTTTGTKEPSTKTKTTTDGVATGNARSIPTTYSTTATVLVGYLSWSWSYLTSTQIKLC